MGSSSWGSRTSSQVERGQLLVGIPDVEPAISPSDGVFVVDADFGRELCNAVLGLRHVVETGVVHDRTGCSVRVGVCFRAERVDGYGVRGCEVVFQSEAVSQFVGGDEPHGIPHEFGGQDIAAGQRVDGSGLETDPRVEDAHHVVPPDDVGLDDFAAAGVDDRWSHGVCEFRCGVGDHRVAHVVDVELLLLIGSDLAGEDGIFEAGGLECLLPLLDPLLDVGYPDGRRGGVDPQHDGLLRFDEFAALVTFDILGPGFEAPAVDEGPLFGLLLGVVEVEMPDFEIAHAVVGETRSHRHGVEQYEIRGDFDGQGCGLALLAGEISGEGGFDDDVLGEGLHGFDFREVAVGAARAERTEEVVETLLAAVEDFVDLDDRRGRIGIVGLDGELFDKRFAVVVPDGSGDAVALAGRDAGVVGCDPYFFIKGVLAESDEFLSESHSLVDSGVVQRIGDSGDLVDDQNIAVEQRIGNLEPDVGTLAVNVEHALVGGGVLEDLLIFFPVVAGGVGFFGDVFGFSAFPVLLFPGFGGCGREQEQRCEQKGRAYERLFVLHFFIIAVFLRAQNPHDAIIKHICRFGKYKSLNARIGGVNGAKSGLFLGMQEREPASEDSFAG